jgi:hypothetical protein
MDFEGDSMKRALIAPMILLAVMGSSTCRQSPVREISPSLEETTRWLNEKLPIYATNTIWKDSGSFIGSVPTSEKVVRELRITNRERCAIAWQRSYVSTTSDGKFSSTDQVTLPLSEIDPGLIEIIQDAKGKVWSLRLHTVDKHQAISFEGETEAYHELPATRKKGLSDVTSIDFTEAEMAARMKLAFARAASLCSTRQREPY